MENQEPNQSLKKWYEVHLTTDQPMTQGEDFWMYRGFEDEKEARTAFQILLSFIPYEKYPATVTLEEYIVNENDALSHPSKVLAKGITGSEEEEPEIFKVAVTP